MGVKEGSVLTMHITLLGQKIMLLNGYTKMSFNESISFVVPCKTQREIDTYWKKLTSGGGKTVQCGWLIDKYGVHWQIAPADFDKWNTSKNSLRSCLIQHAEKIRLRTRGFDNRVSASTKQSSLDPEPSMVSGDRI